MALLSFDCRVGRQLKSTATGIAHNWQGRDDHEESHRLPSQTSSTTTRNPTILFSTLGVPTLALPTMATPVISLPTAVDSSPLLTIGDEKPDKGGQVGQATKLSTALGQATADQQDTSDSDDQDLEGEKKLEVQADKSDSDNETLEGEKEVEVRADTKDKPRPRPRPILVPRPQPRLQPPADVAVAADTAPNGTKRLAPARPRPAASTKHGTGSTKTQGTDAKKQQKGASDAAPRTADAGSETAADATDAGAHDKSRLPFRRNKNGPRKGGKQKEKGALGRVREKVRLIHAPQTCLTRQPTSWFLDRIHP